MQIVNLFYELARQQINIKGFYYRKTYEKGAGNDIYPLTWVDDPISGGQARPDSGVLRYVVNVDILGIPSEEKEVLDVQTAAFNVGLSYIEKIKEIKDSTKISIETFSFISLRDYYDDNAAGFRFTYTLLAPNPVNRCAEYFDPTKELDKSKPLPDFNTENPNGCAVFNDKKGLPNFSV